MANLLIVDDEAGYRQVLKVIFEAEGFAVRTATSGCEALAYLKIEACDLIISDVRMPDMDGIALLREARQIYPDVGVVLMTAFGTIDTAREAFKLGADDFVEKPFNNEELKLIVKRTLDKQAIVSENRPSALRREKAAALRTSSGSRRKCRSFTG
jgi:DNA-binding NtrC family response regulator